MKLSLKNSSMVLLLCSTISVFGQTPFTLGNVKSHSEEKGMHLFKTENGEMELSLIQSDIVHIRIDKKLEENFSYSLVKNFEAISAQANDSENQIIISTSSLDVTVNKNPLYISVKNKDGKTIIADDPKFNTTWNGTELTSYHTIFDDEKFIGLGEKTGNLNRRGNAYTNWNTDAFGYTDKTDPIYVSIPFYIGIHDSLCYGVFLDNSSKSNFNFGASNTRFSSFSVESGELDYYIIYDKNVEGIIEKYTMLTGRTPLPALWSLGFQQCRWSYFPDSEVLNIAKTFREKEIPLDVLYLDIHYMEGYKVFTWDKNRFPEPKKMLDELKSMGIKTTVIIDPGIKVEKNYFAYEQGKSLQHFLKYPDGTFAEAGVWPGLCHFPDFTNDAARKWWGQSFKGLVNDGVAGFWNDMNEPATWGQSFPSNIIFDFDGHPTTTINGRNMFGMQMARATYEGTKQLLNKRPLVLTRAGFAGIQRYSAVWTGDNTASDAHMMLGVRLVNSLGLSGVANCGVDVGGFNEDASAALYTRWMTIGTFTPFFRAHKMINMKASEPWSYGEETEAIAKYYIHLRYRLLPYLYSAFYENSLTGIPVNRSLAMMYPHSDMVYKEQYQNEFLFGKNILIAPVTSDAKMAKVYLTKGEWYDFHNDKKYAGEQEILVEAPLYRLPIFIKAGSIIPMQPAVMSCDENPGDTLYIHIYKGSEMNTYVYYEDDGVSYAFENAAYFLEEITYDGAKNNINFSGNKGKLNSKFKVRQIVLHGFDPKSLPTLNGKKTKGHSSKSTAIFPEHIYWNELYYAPKEMVQTIVLD
ncbi:MAG: glycoside hydrolase family 31 protein [Flavobacteriales bacterium]